MDAWCGALLVAVLLRTATLEMMMALRWGGCPGSARSRHAELLAAICSSRAILHAGNHECTCIVLNEMMA